MEPVQLERDAEAAVDIKEAKLRLKRHLMGLGYSVEDRGERLFCRRGSVLGTLIGFSPKKWSVMLEVTFEEAGKGATAAYASWVVDTTGQLVTDKERRFWETEADEIQPALEGKLVRRSVAADQEAFSTNMKIVAAIVVVTIFFAVFFGFVAALGHR